MKTKLILLLAMVCFGATVATAQLPSYFDDESSKKKFEPDSQPKPPEINIPDIPLPEIPDQPEPEKKEVEKPEPKPEPAVDKPPQEPEPKQDKVIAKKETFEERLERIRDRSWDPNSGPAYFTKEELQQIVDARVEAIIKDRLESGTIRIPLDAVDGLQKNPLDDLADKKPATEPEPKADPEPPVIRGGSFDVKPGQVIEGITGVTPSGTVVTETIQPATSSTYRIPVQRSNVISSRYAPSNSSISDVGNRLISPTYQPQQTASVDVYSAPVSGGGYLMDVQPTGSQPSMCYKTPDGRTVCPQQSSGGRVNMYVPRSSASTSTYSNRRSSSGGILRRLFGRR